MTKTKFFSLYTGTRFSVDQGQEPPLAGQITGRLRGNVMIQWEDGSQYLMTPDDTKVMEIIGNSTVTK